MTACSMCGTTPPGADGDVRHGEAGDVAPASGDGLPLTWVTSRENGLLKLYCPTCARAHLRAIEAKLDSAWW